MKSTGLDKRAASLLATALERERIDSADMRVIAWLCARARTDDPAPLAAVVAALCHACSGGSLCLPVEPERLLESLHDLFGAGETREDAPEVLARAFLSAAAAGAYPSVLGSPSDPAPLILREGLLYFHRHFHAEKTLALDLRARLRLPPPPYDREVVRAVLNDAPRMLTRRQKWALVAALRTRVFILSGGPGTGKTTWIASWLRALLRIHKPGSARVRLCAPTGRAAQRLQESLYSGNDEGLQFPVETLHTLLGYQPYSGRFARTAEDPLDADWVLLDEASMADAFMLTALVQALPPHTGIVLVGDADQLPSVEAGSVLRELLPGRSAKPAGAAELPQETWEELISFFLDDAPSASERSRATGLPPSVTLDESRRTTGRILQAAACVNAGEIDGLLEILGAPLALAEGFATRGAAAEKDIARLQSPEEDSARVLPDWVQAYADNAFLQRRVQGKTYPEWLNIFRRASEEEEEALLPILWEFVSATRVLAPARRGPLSTERVNRLLNTALQPHFSPGLAADARGAAFHGAPVLVTRNDPRTGLSNGESGVWLQSEKPGARGLQACFPRADGWLRLPAALLPTFESGFASTVHKSQGSEYDQILLVLPEAGNRLLAREIFYTGITRAKSRVRILGSEAALREATLNRLRRDSGLRLWFRE